MKDRYIVLIVLICGTPILLGNGYEFNKFFKRRTCSQNEDCHSNEECKENNDHTSSCYCSFNAYLNATTGECELSRTCSQNKDCHETDKCYAGKCVNICYNNGCLLNDVCKPRNDHTYACLCMRHFSRSVQTGQCLVNDPCSHDDDCDAKQKCYAGGCVNSCYNVTCGLHEKCVKNDDHTSSCNCSFNAYLNTTTRKCELNESCSSDRQCGSTEICSAGKCVDACHNVTCGLNEKCVADVYFPSDCECLFNSYRNNLTGQCTLRRPCTQNDDCRPGEECTENDERTSRSCYCSSTAYFNDTTGECELSRNCSQNQECHEEHKCYAGKCVDSCYNITCGLNQRCVRHYDHSSSCSCVMNAYLNSLTNECTLLRNCSQNPDCHKTDQCYAGKCGSSCYNFTCGLNEACIRFTEQISSCICMRNAYLDKRTGYCVLEYKWEKLKINYDNIYNFAIIQDDSINNSSIDVVGRYTNDANYTSAQQIRLVLTENQYFLHSDHWDLLDRLEVLRSDSRHFYWRYTTSKKHILESAIDFGIQGNDTLHVCRLKYKSNSYPGLVRPNDRLCYTDVKIADEYEILNM